MKLQGHLRLARLVLALLLSAQLSAAGAASLLPLRDSFPAGSIDSVDRADQALAAVDARRALMLSDYVASERECYKKFFSNNCIDDLKAERRLQEADFDGVQLEATRYKRNLSDQQNRDQKAQKASDARANAAQDAAQRAQSRLGYEDKQGTALQKLNDKATRSGQDAGNAAAYSSKLVNNTQQQKDRANKDLQANAGALKSEADQKKKEDDAAARRIDLARHRADKAADRAKRASEAASNGQPPPPGSAVTVPDPHAPLVPGASSAAAGGVANGSVKPAPAASPGAPAQSSAQSATSPLRP